MNNSMTLSQRANSSEIGISLKSQHPLKDARVLSAATARRAEEKAEGASDWRVHRLQHDWRMLAGEWQAIAEAIGQFEEEFDLLEKNLNRRWEREGEYIRLKTLGDGPISFLMLGTG